VRQLAGCQAQFKQAREAIDEYHHEYLRQKQLTYKRTAERDKLQERLSPEVMIGIAHIVQADWQENVLNKLTDTEKQLADCQAEAARWHRSTLIWREHAVTRRMQYATARAERDTLAAQLAVLAKALKPLAKVWELMHGNIPASANLTEWGLWSRVDSRHPENDYSLNFSHAKAAQDALANLPASATALLEREQAMRKALEEIAELIDSDSARVDDATVVDGIGRVIDSWRAREALHPSKGEEADK
jgi:hypothetical protein